MGEFVDKARAAIGRVEALDTRARGIFTSFEPQRILVAAAQAQHLADSSPTPLPLAGKLVSVKDLFDEAGETTTAGSRLLQNRAPASADSDAVTRIKAAGAIPFGRTSMSEFAYSGVGLNPHHGTPGNAFDESRIPGGSTSGGAVSVALGLCDIALGTDTGGSVRIPAAANGLFGFKPSQQAVSLAGVHPLSKTLDSAGPLATDLATTITAFAVMSGTPRPSADASSTLKLALPRGAFVADLDAPVAAAYQAAVSSLRDVGHEIVEIDFAFLQAQIGLNRIIVSAEAYALYANDLKQMESISDPNVLRRIRFAETVSADELKAAYATRADVVARFAETMYGIDALVAPTLQIVPPTIVDAEADFDRFNAGMLRNPSLINLADGCALSMPLASREGMPGALMLAGPCGRDWQVLRAAEIAQPSLRSI